MGPANEGNNTAALALEALHKQVLPFLLRRLKEDVLHDLPPKIIQDYYCELSDVQKYLYDNFTRGQEKQAEEAVKSENKEKQQHVFQSLQYLRKLCNHPALVLKEDGRAIQEALAKAGQSKNSQLNDIDHAPKLLALRCAFLLGEAPDVHLGFGFQTTSSRLRYRAGPQRRGGDGEERTGGYGGIDWRGVLSTSLSDLLSDEADVGHYRTRPVQAAYAVGDVYATRRGD